MAVLRQSGLVSGNFGEDAASFCNYAGQMRYKHPRCAQSDAPTILLLPGFERGCFYGDRGTYLCNTMGQVPMQTLAMGDQLPLGGGMVSPGRLVALALFPTQAAFFHTA